jgi:adenine-specific DNA-methyltransferase
MAAEARIFRIDNATSTGLGEALSGDLEIAGGSYTCGPTKHWKTHPTGMMRLSMAERLVPAGKSLGYVRFIEDFGCIRM